ncbi:hypothetical protein Ddc_10119 [Ditylenchus destructor]|nr:hypothetical protein Ddc_10119 [Ditylenchus destructor]
MDRCCFPECRWAEGLWRRCRWQCLWRKGATCTPGSRPNTLIGIGIEGEDGPHTHIQSIDTTGAESVQFTATRHFPRR